MKLQRYRAFVDMNGQIVLEEYERGPHCLAKDLAPLLSDVEGLVGVVRRALENATPMSDGREVLEPYGAKSLRAALARLEGEK